MPICTSNRCIHKGDDQPESEFNGHKWCRTCRERNLLYKSRKVGYKVSGFKRVIIKPGEPPKFRGEWDKRMWEGWLKDLVKEVIR